MKIITKSEEMRKALKKLNPNRIAVAYLGSSWHDYINIKYLKEIIVSPTLGTDSHAIFQIADAIGWENVYFLDRLHTKAYLGEGVALLGSANLSTNAFGDGGSYETLVRTNNDRAIKKLRKAFDQYVRLAQKSYPSKEAKIKQLAKLRKINEKAKQNSLNKNDEKSIATCDLLSIGKVELSTLDIHIVWWRDGDIELNFPVLIEHLSMNNTAKIQEYYYDTVNFHKDYGINEGDWILWWKATEVLCQPSKAKDANLSWTMAHAVIPNGVKSKSDHTKLVAQISDYDPVPVPFDLTPDVESLIKEQLCEKKYTKLRNPHDRPLPRDEALQQARRFLLAIRSRLK